MNAAISVSADRLQRAHAMADPRALSRP